MSKPDWEKTESGKSWNVPGELSPGQNGKRELVECPGQAVEATEK